jgi:hypothetical protein
VLGEGPRRKPSGKPIDRDGPAELLELAVTRDEGGPLADGRGRGETIGEGQGVGGLEPGPGTAIARAAPPLSLIMAITR